MNRSIQTLNFEYIQLNDNVIELMAPFLADNHVFEALEVFVNSQLCLVTFLLMFDYLKEFKLSDEWGDINDLVVVIQALASHTGLRKLQLCGISIGWRGCNSLARLLSNSTTLTEIDFANILGIYADDGWQTIFTALQSTRCKLEKIEFTGVEGLNEHTTLCLSDVLLHHSTTLKRLDLNEQVMVVIPLLQDPNAILEELSLQPDDHDFSLTNEGIEVLTNVLVTNVRLKRLWLCGNRNITSEGWVFFSAVFRNPNSKLEELVLHSNYINDTVMDSFADALTINHKLQKLRIHFEEGIQPHRFNTITVNGGYAALTRTLCNKSSILSTYHSNHILEELCGDPWDTRFLPEQLTTLLHINRENCPSQAARLKIIKTYFCGNIIKMEPFTKMAVSVRPHAIAWMAKDIHVYEFLRAMPSLLEKGQKDWAHYLFGL
jgi:hypothetical protein